MMIFETLRITAIEQNKAADFPSFLMDEIIKLVENRQNYADKINLIEKLITQISNFDLYAGSGCFSDSYGVESIQTTLRQLKL